MEFTAGKRDLFTRIYARKNRCRSGMTVKASDLPPLFHATSKIAK